MDRFILNRRNMNTLKTLIYVTRNFGILHHRNPYVILNSAKCRQCGTQQVSQLSHLSVTKQEWKAWKSILRASGFLTRKPPVVTAYSGGRRSYCDQQQQQQQQKKNEEEKPGEETPPKRPEFNPLSIAGAVFGFLLWYVVSRALYNNDRIQMSWNTFEKDYLIKGQVMAMHIFKFSSGQYVECEMHPDSEFRKKTGKRRMLIDVVSNEDFAEKLRDFEFRHNIPDREKLPVAFSKEPSYMQPLITLVLFLALMALLSRAVRMRGGINKQVEDQIKNATGGTTTDSSGLKRDKNNLVTFAQIAGQKEAIIELKEFVDYVQKPLKYQKIGAKVPRGALLTGPPGCGKTLLAKALAGESKVPFYARAGSEFIEIFGGLGAARIRELFDQARKNAPCIIYIDEIDTIGRKRSEGGMGGLSSETESTLNQLLVEMDGMSSAKGVIVLASTNRAEILDKALLRAGRFDRHILIDLPTLKEREELFQLYLKDIKVQQTNIETTILRLAQVTPGMSGADIANVCNEAAIHAARHTKSLVDAEDLDYAIERVIAGVPKLNKTMSLAEKKVIAYHEAGHVIAKCFLEGTGKLLKASIVPRTSDKPSFTRFTPSDRTLDSADDLFVEMCVSLGGRAAENIVFKEVTNAAEDDLKRVTKIAYHQIKTFGMSKKLGHISFPTDEEVGTPFGRKPYSKQWKRLIDIEASKLVAEAYKETEILLKVERKKLDLVAEELIKKETLNTDELRKLLGFHAIPKDQRKFLPNIELL